MQCTVGALAATPNKIVFCSAQADLKEASLSPNARYKQENVSCCIR